MSSIEQSDIDRLVKLYFKQPRVLYEHLFASYHQLVEEIIPYSLMKENNIFYESDDKNILYIHGFKVENIRLRPATFENETDILFPKEARKNHLNYFGTILADVTQYVEKQDMLTEEKQFIVVDEVEKDIAIAKIPIMVKSKYCSTNIKNDIHGECKYDPGGYFIVNGGEKVVISIEEMVKNKILVFTKKDTSYEGDKYYIAHINSKKDDWSDNLQIINIKNMKNGVISIKTSQLSDIPIFILFKAMGLETDQDIISNITYDLEDTKMLNLLRPSIAFCLDDEGNYIRTKEEAIQYLITKLKRNRRISKTDEDVANIQRRMLLQKILRQDLLPHLGEDIPKKVRFLGLMTNRLLNVMLGRQELDDRDNFQNKRIETPGVLIGQLFRQNWKKLLNEIQKIFRKKNKSDIHPINVIGQIKSNIIEQGIKKALSTGTWGMNKSKKGVAQTLGRLSWIQSIAYFRRFMAPTPDASTSGVTSIRSVNNISCMFCAPVETPEGAKIGIVKSLAMTASITLQNTSQRIVLDLLLEKFKDYKHPYDIDPLTMNRWTKVYFNGDWVAVTKKPLELYTELIKNRRNGKIDKYVSICIDYRKKEIKVYYESGRLIRPILAVQDNNLVFDKKMVKDIEKYLKSPEPDKGWRRFLSEHPNVIDYEDIESSNFLMISRDLNYLEDNLKNRDRKIEYDENSTLNRYGDYRYVNFTHCELHPWLMMGTISCTIPFANHNYSVKNIVNFSQVKQAIGTYLTSYKDRMDISQILYHPQLPIVTTRGMEYNRMMDLPTGENCVVAIMSYTGLLISPSSRKKV